MTGTLKISSNSAITFGGKGADEERIKRSEPCRIVSKRSLALLRTAWWIVGTAVYQVGVSSSIQSKKTAGSKSGAIATLAPADIDERTAPIRPWICNRGMTFEQRSFPH